ncbi:hypothetical protein LTS10_005224 [Elasticomyces elasticus]|nr:hypothetical protein LTS10_005224 [Elasticomyces elasticus]
MPDLYAGDSVPVDMPANFNVMKWAKTGRGGKGHMPDQVDPIASKIISYLRTELHVEKIGSVGYCYGAKYVARFSAKGKGIDAACMCHPSFVDAGEIEAMTVPVSIAAAENDEIFPASKRRETEDILKGKGVPYQMCLYSDVAHGFAVRGDMSDRKIRFAKEAAFLQCVQWFHEHLGKTGD